MRLCPASRRVELIERLSGLLGWIIYAADSQAARTVRENLATIIKYDRPKKSVESDVRRLLSLVAWNTLLINSLPALTREEIAELVPVEGASQLDNHLDDGHPVLIWSYHFGTHPLVVASILHAMGYPIHAITHVLQMPAGATVFQRMYLRRLRGIAEQLPVIDPRQGVQPKMLNVLRSRQCLFVTPDYMMRQDEVRPDLAFVVPVEFLGRRAYLHSGGLRLAKRLAAKVVIILAKEARAGAPRLVVQPFELPTVGLTPADLQCDLQACMRHLEAQVTAQPHLWWDLKRVDWSERLTV
jgi:lauroyl/myristoyl acyltransferase